MGIVTPRPWPWKSLRFNPASSNARCIAQARYSALDLRGFLADRHPLASLWRFIQPWLYGEVGADKSWVPQHYDYGNEFYFAFLDRRLRLYSQALFRSEDESLEDAAENKLDYVMRACRLAPGSSVRL